MRNKVDHKTIINFSKGKYSYNDYLKVKEWFGEIDRSSGNKGILLEQWNQLVDGTTEKNTSMNHIFEKIQYQILLEEKKSGRKKIFLSFYQKAAAVLLIPVLIFSLWYYYSSVSPKFGNNAYSKNWIEVTAPQGGRVAFKLPDSSSVWLNSGAKLNYPANFGKEREVKLVGEAYFEVQHLSKSSFTVSVADMDIKVLGTKFNVSAYNDESFSSVVLNEGKVEIEGKVGYFIYTLVPDEKVVFNRESKTLKTAKVDASRFSAWKDGFLVIDNEPLGQVIPRLERWYNTQIVIQDEKLKSYRFKATFKDELLEEVLVLMAKTTPIKYNIQKREMDEKGILKQRKVTISTK